MAMGLYWASVCLAIFISVLALDIMGFFSRKNHLDVKGKVCLFGAGVVAGYAD